SGMLALIAFGAGCGDAGVTSASRDAASPRAPRLTVGPTTSVTVACPTKMETGTTGPCVAFGYDANGKFASSTVSSWSSSNTSVATISGGTVSAVAAGTATISATVAGVTGSTTVNVVSPLTVSIDGPNTVKPNVDCAFWASVSGGTGSYTYSWSQSAGTGTAYTYEYVARSSSSYTVTVQVTDNGGATGSATRNVTVSSGALLCAL
ncbi:MAG TPA: Ig-like domain-containing protein, partial [Longimicrobium sp.]|nr:Ig-like domain-containing protein [Longimicrobium sp.]